MKLPIDIPPAAEFGLLRAFLTQNGFSQAWINQTIGTAPNSRTRAEITEQLKLALRALPKNTN